MGEEELQQKNMDGKVYMKDEKAVTKAEAAVEEAKAAVEEAKTAVKEAKTAVEEAKAAVNEAKTTVEEAKEAYTVHFKKKYPNSSKADCLFYLKNALKEENYALQRKEDALKEEKATLQRKEDALKEEKAALQRKYDIWKEPINSNKIIEAALPENIQILKRLFKEILDENSSSQSQRSRPKQLSKGYDFSPEDKCRNGQILSFSGPKDQLPGAKFLEYHNNEFEQKEAERMKAAAEPWDYKRQESDATLNYNFEILDDCKIKWLANQDINSYTQVPEPDIINFFD
ncbi:hypothetical protein HDV02_005014 [Globomyces sp. JEL0801]|nr:hypothetical protein HDV02_005014 [Globomyces sp. JEL0801]